MVLYNLLIYSYYTSSCLLCVVLECLVEQFALSDIFPGNVVPVVASIQGRIEDKPTRAVVEIRSSEDTAVEFAAVVLVVVVAVCRLRAEVSVFTTWTQGDTQVLVDRP